MKKFLFWLPRILTIIFIAFDIFAEDYKWYEIIIGVFMHLIPSFALIIILIIAWKRELVGGIIFIILSLIFTIFFNTYRELISFLLISSQ